RHELEQLVMVDLAEAGPAVLVLGHVAVVLDAEAPDLRGTGAEIGDGIDVEIVHHVAGVVVDLDPLIADLADDRGAGGPRARLAAVLLDDEGHAVVAGHRAELLEPLDPEPAVAPLGVAEGEHLRDSPGRRLADA